MATEYSLDYIISDPNMRGGRPVIKGTTICVSDIAAVMIFHRKDPDELAQWFDLPLSQIYAALAYYYDHKEAIDTEIREQDALAQEMKEKRVGSRHDPLLS